MWPIKDIAAQANDISIFFYSFLEKGEKVELQLISLHGSVMKVIDENKNLLNG